MLRTSESHVLQEMSRSPVFRCLKYRACTEDKTHLDHPVRGIVLDEDVSESVVELFLYDSEREHYTVIPGHGLCPGTYRTHQYDRQKRQKSFQHKHYVITLQRRLVVWGVGSYDAGVVSVKAAGICTESEDKAFIRNFG